MSEFIEVASAADFPEQEKRAFIIEGRKILLCRTSEGWFATDNACPHRGGPLVEGDLSGSTLVCPWHFWTFELATGRNDRDPDVCLATHEVRIADDRVYVRLRPGRIEEPNV
jgi:nitrite reductase (NADH) small subunit